MFSSNSFKVSGLILRPDPLRVELCEGWEMWASLLHMVLLFSSAPSWKVFSLLYVSGLFVKHQMAMVGWVFFSWKCVVLMNSYVLRSYGFIVEFEVWFSDNSIMATFARDSFGYLRLFCFYIEFRYSFFYFGENQKFWKRYVDHFSHIAILIILILPIPHCEGFPFSTVFHVFKCILSLFPWHWLLIYLVRHKCILFWDLGVFF